MEDNENKMIELSIAMLAFTIREQFAGIRDSSNTLTATFRAVVKGRSAARLQSQIADDLGIERSSQDRPVDVLKKIVESATARGIDAKNLEALLPTIQTISDHVHAEKLGPFATVKHARQVLRSQPKI